MADNFQYVQAPKLFLDGSGVTATDTSVTVKSLVKPGLGSSTTITMSDFGTIGYGTFEPSTEREENFSFTGITQNGDGSATFTGVTRGLDFVADYTSDTTLRSPHAGGTVVVISNSAQFYNKLAGKDNDETISGTWTFPNATPPKLDSYAAPTADEELASKKYVDDIAAGGTASINRIVVAGTAGENISAGQLVYFDSVTNNEWMLCDADTAATVENVLIGIAQGSGSDGVAISGGVLLDGLDSNQSGLTIGDVMYASDTAGSISSSPGTVQVAIGIAQSATALYFRPRLDQQLTEDQQDAIEGASGDIDSNNTLISQNETSNAATIAASTIAFVDSNPDTITDSGNGFVTAGFRAGQDITVSGSASNDGSYTIATVAAGTLTLISGDSLSAESAGASVTVTADSANKVVRADGSGNIDETFLNITDANATTLTDGSDADSLHNHELVEGVKTATFVKAQCNYSIPWIISSDVPTTNFWTITNGSATSSLGSVTFSGTSDVINSILTTNGIFYIDTNADTLKFNDTNKVIVDWWHQLRNVGDEEIGFGLAETQAPFGDYDDTTVDAACFTVDASGNLYAHTSDKGVGGDETAIAGVTVTDYNNYRIEFDPGVDVKFYVNGVLKATHTEGVEEIPDGANTIQFGFGCGGTTDNNSFQVATAPKFSIEM